MPFIFDKDGNPVDGRKLSQMYAGLIDSINWLANYSVKKEEENSVLRARIAALEAAGDEMANAIGENHTSVYAKSYDAWRKLREQK